MRTSDVLALIILSATILTGSTTNAFSQSDTWSGFKIGAGLGGAWSDTNAVFDYRRDTGNLNNPTTNTDQVVVDDNETSAFAFVRLGYDQKVSSNFLIGLFGDFDFAQDMKTNFSDSIAGVSPQGRRFTTVGEVEFGEAFNIGARVGVLIQPQTLLYATGGYSRINVEGSASIINQAGNTEIALAFDDYLHGIFVGGGLEYEISKHMALSVEYRYARYQGETYSVDGNLLNPTGNNRGITATVDDTDIQTARIGLVLK